MKENFIIKGDICFSKDKDTLLTFKNHYLVCVDGLSDGVYEVIPEVYKDFQLVDYSGKLVIPGLVDLHIHAPQFAFRGLGMDLELLDWLNTNTFPEESKYKDLSYAIEAYSIFTEAMKQSATTRACVFATIHVPATEMLMDMLSDAGICGFVGKVNMDRNSPDYLIESNPEQSAYDTVSWIEHCLTSNRTIKPILTPRFIPTCSDALMKKLSEIQKKYDLPVQSHLSENFGEIAWVRELCPDAEFYGDAYDRFGMFGGNAKTIMAHCVSSSDEEIKRMKERGVYIAHCPESNTNLASGIAPIRRYLDEEMHVGLGSDVAGGSTESIFHAMADAIQVSKLRWRLSDTGLKPLTAKEAFYLGTKGGGAFFGKVGGFDKGYEFDAVVLDDSNIKTPRQLTLQERLERCIYLSTNSNIAHKYSKGRKIF